jgi:hypothetical protein
VATDIGGQHNAGAAHRLERRHQLGQALRVARMDQEIDEPVIIGHLAVRHAVDEAGRLHQPLDVLRLPEMIPIARPAPPGRSTMSAWKAWSAERGIDAKAGAERLWRESKRGRQPGLRRLVAEAQEQSE